MKIVDTTPVLTPTTELEHLAGRINQYDITIISRDEGFNTKRVAMLVPFITGRKPTSYKWVEISGPDIGLRDSPPRTRQEIAQTIKSGGWTINDDASVALAGIPELQQAAIAHSESATVTQLQKGDYRVTRRHRGSSNSQETPSLKKALAMFSEHVLKREG